MNKEKNYIFLLLMAGLLSCVPRVQIDTPDVPLAFPGAEGYGKYTTGGRGGKIYIVTNLEDSGPGTFREACEAKHPRLVVFEVSGTIHLKSKLSISKNITIAGQTAPGEGITIADHSVALAGDNIIIRYIRFRMGDRYQNTGKVHGSGHDDALGGNRKKNILIDHCSISWSTDEAMTIYDGDSTTLQWNIIAEPLNYSYHFEKGGNDYQHHGYGGIWGGKHLSAHHNLFAHCLSRTPRLAGIRSSTSERADYRNNVIYNWGVNNIYGGEGGEYNVVGNYYKAGPSTNKNVLNRIVNPSVQAEPHIGFGKFYVAENFVEGSPEVTANNRKGIHFSKNALNNQEAAIASTAFTVIEIPVQSAVNAYEQVLQFAGASLPARDAVDTRIINDVKNKTGKIIDVQGGHPHGTSYEISKSAWPVLNTRLAMKDSDRDGMPDSWENDNGLDPEEPNDAWTISNTKLYSNVENYINSLTENH